MFVEAMLISNRAPALPRLALSSLGKGRSLQETYHEPF